VSGKYIAERVFEKYKTAMNIIDPDALKQLKKAIDEAIKSQYEYRGYIYIFNYDFQWDVPSDNIILVIQDVERKLTISFMLIRSDNLSIAIYRFWICTIQLVKDASPKIR